MMELLPNQDQQARTFRFRLSLTNEFRCSTTKLQKTLEIETLECRPPTVDTFLLHHTPRHNDNKRISPITRCPCRRSLCNSRSSNNRARLLL